MGSALKIELHSIEGAVWGYGFGTNVGWSISSFDYENSRQTFTVLNPGICDLRVSKWHEGEFGSFIMRYFENGDTETKSKIIVWT